MIAEFASMSLQVIHTAQLDNDSPDPKPCGLDDGLQGHDIVTESTSTVRALNPAQTIKQYGPRRPQTLKLQTLDPEP